MSRHGTASQDVPGWYVEFQANVLRALPRPGKMPGDLDPNTAHNWGKNGQALNKVLREALLSGIHQDIRAVWSAFYRKYFDLNVDFSNVPIPDDPGGFERIQFMVKYLTPNRIVQAMKDHGIEVWTYKDDLDKAVENIAKRPEGDYYAIRVRDGVEADEENKNLSANQLADQDTNVENLEERLIQGLQYKDETGNHLDINNYSLCAGSRYSDGGVPYVGWYHTDDKVRVRYYRPDHSYGGMRARSVVS